MTTFKQLGLSEDICNTLDSLGFKEPTPIQAKAIPQLLEHNPIDFIGLAQTGTGKTAAFGLPLVDLVDGEQRFTQAVIMSPTRELGQQTANQLQQFVAQSNVNVEVVYGGVDINKQIKQLKKPTQIIVATPGRLLDLIRRRAVNLETVQYIVLDEADEMLNMGFKEDIDEIISQSAEERVIWLFSATMPAEIRRIVNRYMRNPLEVAVNTVQKSNADISHQFVITKGTNKIPALRRFLDIQPEMRAIMFCRTKRETQQFADELSQQGYGVEALHGDLTQRQRDAVMKRFKSRSMQLLIATDVAARGIDVNDLTHVFHHTLPDQLESYTHRSGRTGRAGNKGISMAFINSREGRKINAIEKQIGMTFEKVEIPGKAELKFSRINHWANIILNTKVNEDIDEVLANLDGELLSLSKEELLKRLLTLQLDHLSDSGSIDSEPEDLNERGGKKKTREDVPPSTNAEGQQRYFINLGEIDGVTRADLIHFVADIANVDRKSFGMVDVKKNCSFFYLDAAAGRGISKKFEGVTIDSHEIRVNLDTDAPPKRSKPKGGKSFEPKRNRRKERDNRSGGRKKGRRR
ncbi:DEAD/DEAH box helicase [Roseivirga pacifica]|uniref:DEAD/DEAH box helicase n=1 Tax=Roseivirga pacifica TaxID=1267423 RepID=UPI003BAED417